MSLDNFLKTYFDFSYYLCLCPFRLSRTSDKSGTKSEIKIVTWFPQTIFCAVNSFLSLFWMIMQIRLNAPTSYRNPQMYLIVVVYISEACIKLLTMKRFWLGHHRNDILDIFKLLNNFQSKPKTGAVTFLCRRWVASLVCSLFILYFLGSFALLTGTPPMTGFKQPLSAPEGYVRYFWRQMEISPCFLFFFEDSADPCMAGQPSAVANALGVLALLGYYHAVLLMSFWILFITMGTLTLWAAVKSCFGSTESTSGWVAIGNNGGAGVLRKLTQLQELSDKINSLIGNQMTGFLLNSLVNYAVASFFFFYGNGAEVSLSESYIRKLLILYLFLTIGTLLLAADVCQNVHKSLLQV